MGPATHGPREEYFLATTALEEFWDTTRPMLFLGGWCRLYGRRPAWERLENSRRLASPYADTASVQEAFRQVSEIYERVLPRLASALNSIHGEDHSVRYWRIVLGPWLFYYLSVVYDRFVRIKQALAAYPNLTTRTLSPNSFVVPEDTEEFLRLVCEDAYNLQIFSKILAALGKEYPCAEFSAPRSNSSERGKGSLPRRIAAGVSRLYAKTCAGLVPFMLLKNSYFPKRIELQFVIRNAGRVAPVWTLGKRPCLPRDDDAMRSRLAGQKLGGEDEFDECLSSMLYQDVPRCFIEQHEMIAGEGDKLYPNKARAILSANGWYFDEAFKLWAASMAERDTLLLGTQHGGNYGSIANFVSENHETAIMDRYYSWGWTRTDCPATVVPMPAAKLLERTQLRADNGREGILWVATVHPRYLLEFAFPEDEFEDYLAWQQRFAGALPGHIMDQIRFRPHYESYGWDIAKRIEDGFPNIHIEPWSAPFQESLERCRLYVCDHLSTTFIEALAANKPTILFWSPRFNVLKPEAEPYYDLLRSHGILFDTPEAAAAALGAAYGDVESWWNQAGRQAAIRQFCGQFARTSPDAIDIWNGELRRVLAHSPSAANKPGH